MLRGARQEDEADVVGDCPGVKHLVLHPAGGLDGLSTCVRQRHGRKPNVAEVRPPCRKGSDDRSGAAGGGQCAKPGSPMSATTDVSGLAALLSRQCAAVSSVVGEISVPPHRDRPEDGPMPPLVMARHAMNGYSTPGLPTWWQAGIKDAPQRCGGGKSIRVWHSAPDHPRRCASAVPLWSPLLAKRWPGHALSMPPGVGPGTCTAACAFFVPSSNYFATIRPPRKGSQGLPQPFHI